jgi:outer membrane murein-binding lipoprotein Lpp
MEAIKIGAAVVVFILAGGVFGASVVQSSMRMNNIEAGLQQLNAQHQNLVKELNEKIIPGLRAEAKAGK